MSQLDLKNKQLDPVRDYYKSLSLLSYEEHPIMNESRITKKIFFKSLIYCVSKTDPQFKTYEQTFIDLYGDLFGEAFLDDLENMDSINLKELFSDIRKLRYKFVKFGVRFYSYKYIFLAHYLLLRFGAIDQEESALQSIISKDNLNIAPKEASKIVNFTNALKLKELQTAKELISFKKYNSLSFFYAEMNRFHSLVKEQCKTFLVIGTMSSGKSTLLNSLIGKDFFPSQNEACTAKLFTYSSLPKTDRTILSTNDNSSFHCYLDLPNLKKLNEDSSIERVDIEGELPDIYQTKHRVKLIDTPGTNNSLDRTHEKITYQALLKENYDTILYIMNATQLSTDDDQTLLKYVKESLDKDKSNKKNILFIVNKVDEIDEEGNETLDTLLRNTTNYLNQNGFDNPNVIFVSAYAAKLAQSVLTNQPLTRKEKKYFSYFYNYLAEKEMDLNQYSTITFKKSSLPNLSDYYNNELNYDPTRVYQVIKHSGVYQITNLF